MDDKPNGGIEYRSGLWSGIKTVDTYAAQDQRLIDGAVALIFYMASKPDGWRMRLADVQKRFGWGDRAWRTVRDNLADNGYLEWETTSRGHVWALHSRPAEERRQAEPILHDGRVA